MNATKKLLGVGFALLLSSLGLTGLSTGAGRAHADPPDPAFHRIRSGTAGDSPGGICRQALTHPRFENRQILVRHLCEPFTRARPAENRRPVVVEIGKSPLHVNLPS